MTTVKLRMSLPEGPVGAIVVMDDDRAERLLERGFVSAVDTPEVEETTEEALKCEVCGFVAQSSGGLANHARTHEEEE